MKQNMSLHGLVRASYRSVADLAEKLGWSYSKTYRIVTGRQIPNIIEVWALADALDLQTTEEIKAVFLSPDMSTNKDKLGRAG